MQEGRTWFHAHRASVPDVCPCATSASQRHNVAWDMRHMRTLGAHGTAYGEMSAGWKTTDADVDLL
jgi:hypothetical protein